MGKDDASLDIGTPENFHDSTNHNTDFILKTDIKELVKTQETFDFQKEQLIKDKRKISERTWLIMQKEAKKNGVTLDIIRANDQTLIFESFGDPYTVGGECNCSS